MKVITILNTSSHVLVLKISELALLSVGSFRNLLMPFLESKQKVANAKFQFTFVCLKNAILIELRLINKIFGVKMQFPYLMYFRFCLPILILRTIAPGQKT